MPAASKPGPGATARFQRADARGPLPRNAAGAAITRPAVPDEDGAVARLFRDAGRNEDVLVTSGGVSAGDLDLLPAAAARAGFEILFHRVAVRPGKPVAFGRRGATFWFGLPGNPVSTSVCFHLFVRYALDCLEGAAQPRRSRHGGAPDPRDRRAGPPRDLPRRRPRGRPTTGRLRVAPVESLGSHDLAAHARSNALIRIPADAERLAEGATVDCLRLER